MTFSASADTTKKVFCETAGRGVSTFARLNLAEIAQFQATRTEFQHRLIQFDPSATQFATDNNHFPSAAQAYQECALGTDNTGAVVSPAASLVLDIQSFTRPAFRNQAMAHPDIQWINLRSPRIANPLPNMHWYVPQEYRAWYVKGVVAAMMSHTGHIGMEIPLDQPDPALGSPAQFVTNSNAFMLGAKSVNPSAVITTISTATYNETAPAHRWPGFDQTNPSTIPPYLNCKNDSDTFNPADNFDATPITDLQYPQYVFPRDGVPLDCLALNKLAGRQTGIDPNIDVIAHQKSSFFQKDFTFNHLQNANNPLLVDNQMSTTMQRSDQSAFLDDQRVLAVTEFNFQPVLNQIADQYEAGTLPAANQEYIENINGVPTISLSRLSSLLSQAQQQQVNAIEQNVFSGSVDPFCGDEVRQYLGSDYMLDANGCLSVNDQINGTKFATGTAGTGTPAYNQDPAALGPAGQGHVQCVPVTDPNANQDGSYPLECAS
jgi:hypothetical protein